MTGVYATMILESTNTVTDMHLYQITSSHFCAGIVRVNGVVKIAAPIVKYMTGWPIGKVRRYCEQKGWGLEWVE